MNATALMEPVKLESILAVDDNDTVREMVQTVLEDVGYQVVMAANALEAITQSMEAPVPFDLLLTDRMMPAVDGLRLARIMRGMNPDMRVIFMTGYPDNMVIEDDSVLTHGGLLEKPFGVEELLVEIRRVLND